MISRAILTVFLGLVVAGCGSATQAGGRSQEHRVAIDLHARLRSQPDATAASIGLPEIPYRHLNWVDGRLLDRRDEWNLVQISDSPGMEWEVRGWVHDKDLFHVLTETETTHVGGQELVVCRGAIGEYIGAQFVAFLPQLGIPSVHRPLVPDVARVPLGTNVSAGRVTTVLSNDPRCEPTGEMVRYVGFWPRIGKVEVVNSYARDRAQLLLVDSAGRIGRETWRLQPPEDWTADASIDDGYLGSGPYPRPHWKPIAAIVQAGDVYFSDGVRAGRWRAGWTTYAPKQVGDLVCLRRDQASRCRRSSDVAIHPWWTVDVGTPPPVPVPIDPRTFDASDWPSRFEDHLAFHGMTCDAIVRGLAHRRTSGMQGVAAVRVRPSTYWRPRATAFTQWFPRDLWLLYGCGEFELLQQLLEWAPVTTAGDMADRIRATHEWAFTVTVEPGWPGWTQATD